MFLSFGSYFLAFQVGGAATGAGRAVRLGKMGASGIVLRDTGVVGVVGVGVFEEDRNAEGNETMCHAVLRFAKCVKRRD